MGASLRQAEDVIKIGNIKADTLFTTGGGDSLTGMDRPMKIWINGGASSGGRGRAIGN